MASGRPLGCRRAPAPRSGEGSPGRSPEGRSPFPRSFHTSRHTRLGLTEAPRVRATALGTLRTRRRPTTIFLSRRAMLGNHNLQNVPAVCWCRRRSPTRKVSRRLGAFRRPRGWRRQFVSTAQPPPAVAQAAVIHSRLGAGLPLDPRTRSTSHTDPLCWRRPPLSRRLGAGRPLPGRRSTAWSQSSNARASLPVARMATIAVVFLKIPSRPLSS